MKTAVIAVPRLEIHRPPPGPAIVANICANQGHDVTVYDLNIHLYHYCQDIGVDYHGFDSVFDQVSEPTQQQQQTLTDFINHWVDCIVDNNYDYIMLAVFGISATWFAERLLETLRPKTTAKIVIGGMGVGTFSLVNPNRCFGEKMRSQKLINDYIVGEAEYSLITYFNGGTGPGINNTEYSQIDNIENLPEPDYSYFNLDHYSYLYPGQREVYITGSRGCVRKCTYCDVERFWPKFRYRSGQSISDEIIKNYEKFGVTRFYFTDSLINGSLKVFADMCDKLARYQFETPISWSGQFIFRQKKTIPRDHFATMAAAGADILFVGIETGSDRVRRDMGKNFTNDDIDFQLEQCSENGIKVIPLMFTGYITESLEDHLDNLKVFERWQRFVADGTITGVEMGNNLVILPGAPVARMVDSHGLSFMLDHYGEPNTAVWQSASNPDLTVREQIRRKLEVHYTAIKYKWPVWRQQARLQEFKNYIMQNKLWRSDHDFYQIKSDSNSNKIVIPILKGE
jgi:hypothetical protein